MNRIEFTFKTWRPRKMASKLRVDEAIERIGLAEYPNKWGAGKNWELLPVFVKKGELWQLTPTTPGSKDYEWTSARDNPGLEDVERMFKTACKMLSRFLRDNPKAVRLVDSEGKQHPLTAEMLFVQRIRIFGAGYAKYLGKTCRIWISKRQFSRWIWKTFPRANQIDDATINYLQNTLIQLRDEGILKSINGAMIERLIEEWLGKTPGKKTLLQIKSNLKSIFSGGRPLLEPKNRSVRTEIIERLRSGGSNKPSRAAGH